MPRPRIAVWMISMATIIPCAGVASAQIYPDKPIRIVAAGIGGGAEFLSRLIAPDAAVALGQPLIIDNRPPLVATEIASKAPSDGYTLFAGSSSFWVVPFLQKVSYDPVADFSPVTLAVSSPNMLVVHPSVAANSVNELIALAKAKPGVLNYATGPAGSPNHLAAELFKSMAGINMVRIAYKGGGPALTALMGGEVQVLFASVSTAIPQLKSGRLKALAITSAKPSALAPDMPTIAAAGLPGYEMVSPDSFFAPAKTPAAIINRLNQELVRIINKADLKQAFFNVGTDTVGSSPAELAAFMKADMAKWGRLIKEAGIRAE